ncbi:SRPBCC domain-containing protein [Paenibacillus athensensis]|uniref:ATPase n=1 Tax=Paenibacillus athensensis TaxID=1967502 RepID=A0A4Y8Q3V1_9BACL|nr:SRPBCC domain-containing protein [Paenibacillus athensensis]MCD1258413.1 SRPBCC domain-containing protein [Paenibacillus athensensis]
MSQAVSLDFEFASPVERVWRALTDSDMLAKWVMSNDFKPVVGHKFQFRTEPTGWWNGIIDCEVLVVDEPHTLSYTWVSGNENTTVTWTLKNEGAVTRLFMEQSGFSSATPARAGAEHGWKRMVGELTKLLEA